MGAAYTNIYLSKVNDSANPEWVTFDEIKEAYMKGRTIITVDTDGSMSHVYRVNADGSIASDVVNGFVAVPT